MQDTQEECHHEAQPRGMQLKPRSLHRKQKQSPYLRDRRGYETKPLGSETLSLLRSGKREDGGESVRQEANGEGGRAVVVWLWCVR